jgi:hypothetical protein
LMAAMFWEAIKLRPCLKASFENLAISGARYFYCKQICACSRVLKKDYP